MLSKVGVWVFGGLITVAGCGSPVVDEAHQSATSTASAVDCTLTQGYWKTHPEAWPVSSLTLGTVAYAQADLLAILGAPVKGNGLIALAHQLIAAKLNGANGADASSISPAIVAADALIGSKVVPPIGTGSLSPGGTSSLVAALEGYNSGKTGPGHCGSQPPPPPPACGNGKLEAGEQCDDGNVENGDGCSSTCTIEPPPPPPPACGNGKLEAGEQCDDRNVENGDGCSSTCTIEPPPPPPPSCGNGILEAGEACDDGSLANDDGCSCTCTIEPPPEPVCGNGKLEAGEECDDGNLLSDDGCSCSCTVEPVCGAT